MTDSGVDAPADVGVDAPADVGVDATAEVGVDAKVDVGVDAKVDVGVDAKADVGGEAIPDLPPPNYDVSVDSDSAPDGPLADLAALDAASTRLTNLSATCGASFYKGFIYAAPNEFGHLAAARLTPPSYPLTVKKIIYDLAGKSAFPSSPLAAVCDQTFAHRVEVWAETSTKPSASPKLHETINVPAISSYSGVVRTLTHTLTKPLTLTTGQHLFVGVEMQGNLTTPADSSKRMCIMACTVAAQADRNYWSNAVKAPYPWGTLASFGLNFDYWIEAE